MQGSKKKKKGLWLNPIGMNILVPGAGYFYTNKWIAGIIGCAVSVFIIAKAVSLENSGHIAQSQQFYSVYFFWLVGNVVGSIISVKKYNRQLDEANQKQCPQCKETIHADAHVCKHCGFKYKNNEVVDNG